MSLPPNTGHVLVAAYPVATSDQIIVTDSDGVVLIEFWDSSLGGQPTEQQISDWATDAVALPSGQLFSSWLAENGGDETLTRRREARDEVDELSGVGVRNRALIELLNKRDNYLTNRIAELQSTLVALQSSGGNANSRLDGLPTSYLATSTRPKSDAVQDYKDDITAGNQDT